MWCRAVAWLQAVVQMHPQERTCRCGRAHARANANTSRSRSEGTPQARVECSFADRETVCRVRVPEMM